MAILLALSACGGGGDGGGGTGGVGGGGGGISPAPPVFGNLAFTVNENVALQGQITATGSGTITYTATGSPTSGKLTSFSSAGAFVYQPNANFVGSDSFTVGAASSTGPMTAGTVTITIHANTAPTATNSAVRADGSALTSLKVLANAKDPDSDPLTVTIEQPPLVGNASVNSDGTVSLTGLPSDFKGLTRFKFRVTDPSGAYAVGTMAVLVGADPFRVAFAADSSASGSPEVYLTDFANPPKVMSAATQGTFRLRGFAVSDNGSTIVYRSEDTNAPGTSTLAFVQTASPTPTAITLPSGLQPVQDSSGKDQFRVSPDGKWIALIAGQSGSSSLYVVSVTNPPAVTPVIPMGTAYATLPRFSQDSRTLYFLSSGSSTGSNKYLYLTALANPGAPVQVSSPANPGDDISDYSVSQDQSRILIEATRSGTAGFFFIDPQKLRTEVPVSAPLLPGESIPNSTIALPPGKGGSASGARIAYTVQSATMTYTVYVASVSATPNPTQVTSSATRTIVDGFRPDDAALLYTRGGEVYEDVIGSGTADQLVGGGGGSWYDSTGNIVLLAQSLASGGSPAYYPALAATVRGSFGTTQPVGTGLAAQYFSTSGFDRGVALIGEGPTTGAAPATVPLALVNALAPDKLLYLFDSQGSQTPLQMTSDVAYAVTD